MKRLLALFLSIALILSCIPVTYTEANAAGDSSPARYSVLVLDVSDTAGFKQDGETIYTADSSINEVKQSAVSFLSSLMNSAGNNYVAVVTYSTYANILSDFTNDISNVKDKVNNLSSETNLRDINAGLNAANNLLAGIDSPQAIKNVILVTTGMTNQGESNYEGHYNKDTVGSNWHRIDTQINLYAYANAAYKMAEEVKKNATLYVLGLFQSMKNIPYVGRDIASFFKITAFDLATSEKTFYDVADPSDIDFAFGQVAQDISKKQVPFSFTGFIKDYDITSSCYYSDAFFMGDARKYDSHLATMSLSFELTTWTSGNDDTYWPKSNTDISDKTKCRNAKRLLCDELQFNNFTVNDFWFDKPQKDSIGVVAANKELPDGSTLVALGVRGGGYDQEWASNFTMGKEGNHKGFATARDNVLTFLDNYLNNNDITGKVKLWLVGYSRAGAVANMTGGAINDYYKFKNGVSISQKDSYVYTFEAPQGVLKSNLTIGNYSNIHNIINLNDIVPLVAPGSWGFTRYANVGGEIKIPSKYANDDYLTYKKSYDQIIQDMYTQYMPLAGSDQKNAYRIKEDATLYKFEVHPEYILPGGNPFIEKKSYTIPFSEVLAESTAFLFDGAVGDRETYYYNYQAGVREVLSLIYGGELSDLTKQGMSIDEFFSKFFKGLTFERFTEIIKPAYALNLDSVSKRKEKIRKNIENYVKEVTEDSDLWGSVLFVESIKDTLTDLMWNLFQSTINDCINNETKSLQSLYNLIIGVVDGSLFQAHWPEITLAWMRTLDSYYNTSIEDTKRSSGRCRIIHINCPVNVSVYDSDKKLRAKIVNDTIQTVGEEGLAAYINEDGEKIVVLPADGEYNIDIDATDKGKLNVGISEYDISTMSSNRIINYYDIPITKGDKLRNTIPSYSEDELEDLSGEGSSVEYKMYNNEGDYIQADEDFNGDLKDHTLTVDISANNTYGYVNGGGKYLQGNFAEVTATANAGGSFEGWYDENAKLVSKDTTYRFSVKENVKLVAHFSAVQLYELCVNASEGGTVENETINVPAGVNVQLKAKPNTGYTFVGWETDYGKIDNSTLQEAILTTENHNTVVTAKFQKALIDDVNDNKKLASAKNMKTKKLGTIKIVAGGKLSLKAYNKLIKNYKNYKWTSSNKKMVHVNKNGILIVSKKGKAKTFTLKGVSKKGQIIQLKVRVIKKAVKKITIKGKKKVKAGKTLSLKAKVKGAKGSYKKVYWTITNKKLASISGAGILKTKKKARGKKVKVTAIALDGSGVKSQIIVSVK